MHNLPSYPIIPRGEGKGKDSGTRSLVSNSHTPSSCVILGQSLNLFVL
jgi:hypothetical protein